MQQDNLGMKTEIKAIFFDIGSTLVNPETRSWLPGMREGVKAIISRGFPVGIISDTHGYTRQKLLEDHLPPNFNFSDFVSSMVILSDEVGMNKSDSRIWPYAAEKANERIDRCLFVGEDSGETSRARKAGMQAMLIGKDTKADMKALIELLDTKNWGSPRTRP
jgi:FMN phosphatase YigB (HAD superfamily)